MANRFTFYCLAFFLLATASILLVNGRLIEETSSDNGALDAESESLTFFARRLNHVRGYGRTLRRRGDDDDDGYYGRKGDDDDDGYYGRKGDDDDDDGHRGSGYSSHPQRRPYGHHGRYRSPSPSPRPPSPSPSPSPQEPASSPGDSSSVTNMRGVLGVVVFGDGRSCFVKVFQTGMTYREQFGDSTSTSAFINLFGRGECEPGARGIAYGVVEAGVMAEANRRGDTCESNVISFVTTRVNDPDPDDGVSVQVGGAAGGEALAVCN